MDSGKAAVRAAHTQNTVGVLDRYAPSGRERVLQRLEPALRSGILEAMPGDFIPATWDLAVVQAIEEVLGREQPRRIARSMMLVQLEGTLLGALVHGARTLFGTSPDALFRWAGKAHGHVARNCGELEPISIEPPTAELGLTKMPHSLIHPSYLEALAGTMESVFDVCGVEGTVEILRVTGDGARFRATWSPGTEAAR
jgi:hypothetical protein